MGDLDTQYSEAEAFDARRRREWLASEIRRRADLVAAYVGAWDLAEDPVIDLLAALDLLARDCHLPRSTWAGCVEAARDAADAEAEHG